MPRTPLGGPAFWSILSFKVNRMQQGRTAPCAVVVLDDLGRCRNWIRYAGDVRRYNNFRMRPERMIGRQGFLTEHIQASSRQVT